MFQHIIKNVPPYPCFLTLKEMDISSQRLAEKYPHIVTIFESGRSTKGHPIYCLKIGSGSKNAFLYGCPHPNEPVGAMMLEYFSTYIAEHDEFRKQLDYTWYIVKCSDPDGMMLNEGWFKGPFTISNYAKNFFRPASFHQVDWSFPIHYKKLNFRDSTCEAQALMGIIEESLPTFVCPLHNAGFGGTYWYMSYGIPEIIKTLNSISTKYNVPLSLGEAEAPYAETFGPAVYKTLSIKDEYDYIENYTQQDPSELIKCGTCGLDYAIEVAKEKKVFGLVTEVPYFYDSRISDLTEIADIRKNLVLDSCNFEEASNKDILHAMHLINPHLSRENVFAVALYELSQGALGRVTAKRKLIENNSIFLKKAKISEKLENEYLSKFFTLLSYGMLLRLIEYELTVSKDQPIKKGLCLDLHQKYQLHFEELACLLEKELHYHAIPIQTLIRIQLECSLVVAQSLNKK